MDTILTKKNEKTKSIVFVALIILIFIFIIIILQLLYTILKNDKVYKGVYVDGINAGGLTYNELNEILKNKYNYELDNVKVTLTTEKYKEKYSLRDLNISFDVEATIDKAFSIGREGNIFERLSEIFYVNFNDVNISPVIIFDNETIGNIVESFYEKNFVPLKNPVITFDENSVIINSGHHGESIDKDQLFSEIKKSIESRKITKIEVPIIVTEREKINLEDYYNTICTDPVNASVRIENNVLETIPHKNGRRIDKTLLEGAVKELNTNENLTKSIPVTLIEPEITTEKLHANLFRDVLATYKTYFSTDSQYNIDRNENLRLALECVNGIMLAPGDIFSFDKTLGERTEEKGYKSAKIFSGGKIIESIGGGICQVSSTLYNAVLRADLEVVERHNHSFVVSYIPAGLDAAVAYNVIDFKFKNSSRWPIKIEGKITNSNELIFTILGTNENPGKSLEFYTQVLKTTEFKTIYIDDPTMPEGKTVVKQEGINGYVVDTYKIVKQNGQETNRYKISTSVYIPLDKEVVRGTKKEQQQPQQQQQQQPDLLPPVETSEESSVESNVQPTDESPPESYEEYPIDSSGESGESDIENILEVEENLS
ncbi:MAG: VanW family protein [Firmicutes bacterium]|nr:VanW family protein [Bacillota bacterium]